MRLQHTTEREMRHLIKLLLLLIVLALSFAAYSFYVWRSPYTTADTTLFIEPGVGARQVLKQLHEQQMAPAPWKIAFPLLISGRAKTLKAGEYAIVADLSPEQVLTQIAKGGVVVHAVTIPEGFTVAQVRAVLMKEPLLEGDLPMVIEEGSVFPDTVHFIRGETRAKVLKRLQEQMLDVLNEAWRERAEGVPLKSAREALTLASIVEEETGVPQERGRVAAVYVNRLKIGMKLQADPTVAYGIAPEGMTRELTTNDLARDTPYNTYTRTGLPPTPICNPGKASIEAVLNPPSSEELYFVATGTGGHYFARTEKEHINNVKKYRAEQRAQKARTPLN